MTQQDPALRPTAAEVEFEWRRVRGRIYGLHKLWRLTARTEPLVATLIFDSANFISRGYRVGKQLFTFIADMQG